MQIMLTDFVSFQFNKFVWSICLVEIDDCSFMYQYIHVCLKVLYYGFRLISLHCTRLGPKLSFECTASGFKLGQVLS